MGGQPCCTDVLCLIHFGLFKFVYIVTCYVFAVKKTLCFFKSFESKFSNDETPCFVIHLEIGNLGASPKDCTVALW
ncbi:hypothetical protein EB796_022638 [Bugula neritina]|uniref:Uncharacterized protein n=1 Tax=Bugula neritina TaxID=10212 RepID=A0A7J7IZP1_BUGNE|nr:hypothetical protein EB796_022638 [Bugula neritina]